jgi:carbon-monoxide dehydrogenase small subunit
MIHRVTLILKLLQPSAFSLKFSVFTERNIVKLTFELNGNMINIDTPDDRRVVDLLREDLGLTGTKEGCATGECGACTILVDGEIRLSCLMMAAQLEGTRVITVEGLELTPEGTAIRRAFAEEGAVQCGFCTPGMEIAAVALLRRDPPPGREEVREGLSGNLCRCTGYVKIVDAVMKAKERVTRGVGE